MRGATQAGVCVIGGGYVGLWTAYWLKEWQPSTDVVVLEQDLCGSGASGRNGGFVLSWWAKYLSLRRSAGKQEALRACRESEAAVRELGAICSAHGIDAHYVPGGWLWTARTESQRGAWEGTVRALEEVAPEVFQRLEPEEVARRAGSPQHLAGVFEASAATVQPALLARGLRRVCLERGVRIHEGSRVRDLTRESPPTVETDQGSVRARVLVIAANAWSAAIRELRRSLIVVSSDMVATAPIPDRLFAMGWTGGECITDSQLMIDYYRTTREGRIAFGKGGWGIALGGRIPPSFDRSLRRAEGVTADLHHAYPRLRDVPVEFDWSGPIDRSPDGLPLLGYLGGRRHILYGVGWSGNGVGPSLLGGKVLAARVLQRDDWYGAFPLWDRRMPLFPPEPVRYVGAHLVREAVRRKERAEAAGRNPSPIYRWLSRFVPAGVEDH